MSTELSDVRNEFRGTIHAIHRGQVMSQVDVETCHGIVTSLILTCSVDRLGLHAGSTVVAWTRSTAVSIATC
jgi:molybdopterin-binding protein